MAELATFACPACRKRFGWKPDLAGRKVRCTGCNLKLRIPASAGGKAEPLEPMPGAGAASAKPPKPATPRNPQKTQPPASASTSGDEYDLSLDDDLMGLAPSGPATPPALSSAAGGDKCPSCGQKVKPGAVICINCGFNLKAGKRLTTAVEAGGEEADAPSGAASAPAAAGAPSPQDERWKRLASQVQSRLEDDAPSDFKEKWAPLILLGVGVVLLLLDAFVLMYMEPDYLAARYYTDVALHARLGRLIEAGVVFAITVPFAFIGLIIVAKLFGSAYGGIMMAIYKLAGVVAFTVAVGHLFGSIMDRITDGVGDFVGYLSLAVELAAFWIGTAFAFDDMEPFEVMVLYLIVRLLPWLVGFFLIATVLSMFG